MDALYGYKAGANLGHWISQYGNRGAQHWDTYITEPDIARAAAYGMDHLRVPVDYMLFEDDSTPGKYSEFGLSYIDRCLLWCKRHGLSMILDLHHAPGYFFNSSKPNTLLTDECTARRFLDIWHMFALRYKDEGENLSFELLNELVWENSDPWNLLWKRAVEVIRKISPKRRIFIGGNSYNSVHELKNLDIIDDDMVFYTFHMYEPFLFTHQRAPWTANRDYTKPVHYPMDVCEHTEKYGGKIPDVFFGMTYLDRSFLRRFLMPAAEFTERTGKPLYCGEFGVYCMADLESTIRWYSDLTDIFAELGIGHAVWSLRGFDHVTDDENNIVSERVMKILSRH